MENYYTLLGITPNATNDEIRKAFKLKANEYHPDKNGDVSASKLAFRLVKLAEETLLNAEKRLEHDYAFGIKKRPEPAPKIVEITREKIIRVPVEQKGTNTGGIIIGSLILGALIGAIFSGDKK